jgi:DNA invertase Pin-like site-specific DNA recombinase
MSKQETENQRRKLEAPPIGPAGGPVYEHADISGAKGRDKRPGLDDMMKAVRLRLDDLAYSAKARRKRAANSWLAGGAAGN